jgi:hypothetical protein
LKLYDLLILSPGIPPEEIRHISWDAVERKIRRFRNQYKPRSIRTFIVRSGPIGDDFESELELIKKTHGLDISEKT